MRGELVSFDLETTGLDAETDAIIEIGAVRLKDGEIIDEYSVLIDPGFMIPQETSYLTGIQPEDVKGAPRIQQVLPEFSQFVGNAPVIAHNAMFDVTFIRQHKILMDNLPLDTFELAALLLPTSSRYNLSVLTEYFGIDLEHAHRALDDARATAYLYWHLWQLAVSLPPELLREIVRHAEPFDWDLAPFFGDALQASLERDSAEEPTAFEMPALAPPPDNFTPLVMGVDLKPLTPEDVEAIIGEDGKLAQQIDAYESRDQQTRMAHEIGYAFDNGAHLIIEAGTGTGKSLAYLTPAALWATMNQQRVVISTNTNNLQDQLVNKDVPLIESVLDSPLKTAVMKGRSHYLCPRRLAAVRRRSPNNIDELRTLTKILIWLQTEPNGSRDQLNLRGSEFPIWRRLSAEDEGCTTESCRSIMGGICPFYKSRLAAEAAHLVVINHALLIADARADNHVIPEYQYLVVDEAHQLEDAITDGLTLRVGQVMVRRRLSELGGPNQGLLGDLIKTARDTLPDKAVMKLEAYAQHINEAIQVMIVHVGAYFKALRQFVEDIQQDSDYPQRSVRITSRDRGKSGFARMQRAWQKLDEFFTVLSEAMSHLTKAIQRYKEKYEVKQLADHIKTTGASASFMAEVREHLYQFSLEPDPNQVYWVSMGASEEFITVVSAPLHVGPFVENYLWQAKESVVLTSATLRTELNFQHIQDRLYADRVHTLALGSPFNYEDSTLIYIPTDIPEPNRQGYQKAVERGIVELAAALQGRVMVLFTSYAQLKETAREITPRLALGDIAVYDQAGSVSRETLLEGFKTTEKAVLLGTRSFWEGVDIPGESLSALVIVRLPFSVPSDPIFAARSDTYENSFRDYAIPDAILRFRQGFGRLIRTRTDRGIVALFDSRIINKRYGQHFLESLPDCTVQQGHLAKLPQIAVNWLQLKSE